MNLQHTIDEIKKITHSDITVLADDGKIAASTEAEPSLEGTRLEAFGYVVISKNALACEFTAFHLRVLIAAHEELPDRDNFIKNLLLDNLLPVDIYSRAKKLRIENGARRVVYLIETAIDMDGGALEILREIFPDRQKALITAVDETSIILVKELHERVVAEEIEQAARVIVDTLSTEAMSRCYVAIGTVVADLKNISASFKEARLAREVGKIFEAEKQIVNCESLGLGRLIYQLPLPLCRLFISEMLQGFNIDDIDEELFATITKFFQHDLNVSDTARELFIHRNTLVYRLDKLQKLTRLDLRKFTDAIIFKIALMVNRYVQYTEGAAHD